MRYDTEFISVGACAYERASLVSSAVLSFSCDAQAVCREVSPVVRLTGTVAFDVHDTHLYNQRKAAVHRLSSETDESRSITRFVHSSSLDPGSRQACSTACSARSPLDRILSQILSTSAPESVRMDDLRPSSEPGQQSTVSVEMPVKEKQHATLSVLSSCRLFTRHR